MCANPFVLAVGISPTAQQVHITQHVDLLFLAFDPDLITSSSEPFNLSLPS
jgi:hypothetical protein